MERWSNGTIKKETTKKILGEVKKLIAVGAWVCKDDTAKIEKVVTPFQELVLV